MRLGELQPHRFSSASPDQKRCLITQQWNVWEIPTGPVPVDKGATQRKVGGPITATIVLRMMMLGRPIVTRSIPIDLGSIRPEGTAKALIPVGICVLIFNIN